MKSGGTQRSQTIQNQSPWSPKVCLLSLAAPALLNICGLAFCSVTAAYSRGVRAELFILVLLVGMQSWMS